MEKIKKEMVRHFVKHYVEIEYFRYTYHVVFEVEDRDPGKIKVSRGINFFQFFDKRCFELNGRIYEIDGEKINLSLCIVPFPSDNPEIYELSTSDNKLVISLEEAKRRYNKEKSSHTRKLFKKEL